MRSAPLRMLGLVALFLGVASAPRAETGLDERGQPRVAPLLEMVWTPLSPCGWRLSLQSTTSLGQLVGLRATDGEDGYRVSPPLPHLLFVPAGGTVFANDFVCLGDSAPADFKGVTWNQNWSPPPGEARHADGAVYRLPFAAGMLVEVGQDAYGTITHHNEQARAYSIDFQAPEGTAIHAARDGIVRRVEQRFHLGGFDDNDYYGSRGNEVVIQHDDGTYAQYGHLRHLGATVAVGQTVRAGERIGYAGSTGVSNGPHLHFSVSRPLVDGAPQSLVLRFRVRESRSPVELREGDRYSVVD